MTAIALPAADGPVRAYTVPLRVADEPATTHTASSAPAWLGPTLSPAAPHARTATPRTAEAAR
ncbi:hypothetical protein [Pseudonocardia sp. WMMC193]|uniref:hypothetical protein n=1 Tax=Pseudonocardia sp. WMMC193 TaxID=2911965 RepID=UPI001F291115|nr:hypothetical protein [Pseudonocardia sp. WMMC193]MCF7553574.1 hypothetical protein [Pseudonocardia sp. WMMC193]